jgi:hypothetical protein
VNFEGSTEPDFVAMMSPSAMDDARLTAASRGIAAFQAAWKNGATHTQPVGLG